MNHLLLKLFDNWRRSCWFALRYFGQEVIPKNMRLICLLDIKCAVILGIEYQQYFVLKGIFFILHSLYLGEYFLVNFCAVFDVFRQLYILFDDFYLGVVDEALNRAMFRNLAGICDNWLKLMNIFKFQVAVDLVHYGFLEIHDNFGVNAWYL